MRLGKPHHFNIGGICLKLKLVIFPGIAGGLFDFDRFALKITLKCTNKKAL